jgi:uncharacterized repeat protein (TIGR03803 family)
VQGLDGNFYGTTYQGGANPNCSISGGCGTVFKVTPQGILTTLHSFDGEDGGFSYGGVVLGKDGQFYGTTTYGEPSDAGTIFKISANGTFTNLYRFCARSGCPDGRIPEWLVQDAAGNFYGTTSAGGGANNGGTVFKMTPSGTFTTLHRFCVLSSCPDGARPIGPLKIGADGNLYGTTYAGGTNYDGTVYRISPSGKFMTLHTFSGADGANPYDGLVTDTQGDFYGTTAFGGKNSDGTIFTMTPAGQVTVLHDFDQADGYDSEAGLTLAADGNFYGTTYLGGTSGYGVLFKLAVQH